MVPAADKLKQKLADKNEANGPAFKIYNDPRLTTIGKILSHTGLDELPQLYNILHGDMAIVGPRPLPVPEAKKLLLWQRERTIVKPGIVSPWVVNGYHSNSFEEWMKSDIIYAHSKNMFGDVLLLARGLLFFIELVAKETGRMYERIQL
jgi:lipopolysaccharide/colanic/teichoic acid biosynthesis glycosyltransferase